MSARGASQKTVREMNSPRLMVDLKNFGRLYLGNIFHYHNFCTIHASMAQRASIVLHVSWVILSSDHESNNDEADEDRGGGDCYYASLLSILLSRKYVLLADTWTIIIAPLYCRDITRLDNSCLICKHQNKNQQPWRNTILECSTMIPTRRGF